MFYIYLFMRTVVKQSKLILPFMGFHMKMLMQSSKLFQSVLNRLSYYGMYTYAHSYVIKCIIALTFLLISITYYAEM